MGEEYYQKIFSENLRYYMKLNDKEQIDLINDLGFNKSAVSTWCNGTRLPRMDKVDALAKYFHIKRSDLIEKRSSADDVSYSLPLSTDERDIIIKYRQSDEITKEMVHRALGIEIKGDVKHLA